MITGEERIREHVGQVYGDVNNYEGRPSDYQVKRTDSLARELEDVIRDFRTLTTKELPTLNPALRKKKLAAIEVPKEEDWQKLHDGGSGSGTPMTQFREVD